MKNKTDKQLNIIKVATELIGKKGVEKTSLADIAREAGISKGTLYYYYPTKNDIRTCKLVFEIAFIDLEFSYWRGFGVLGRQSGRFPA